MRSEIYSRVPGAAKGQESSLSGAINRLYMARNWGNHLRRFHLALWPAKIGHVRKLSWKTELRQTRKNWAGKKLLIWVDCPGLAASLWPLLAAELASNFGSLICHDAFFSGAPVAGFWVSFGSFFFAVRFFVATGRRQTNWSVVEN